MKLQEMLDFIRIAKQNPEFLKMVAESLETNEMGELELRVKMRMSYEKKQEKIEQKRREMELENNYFGIYSQDISKGIEEINIKLEKSLLEKLNVRLEELKNEKFNIDGNKGYAVFLNWESGENYRRIKKEIEEVNKMINEIKGE